MMQERVKGKSWQLTKFAGALLLAGCLVTTLALPARAEILALNCGPTAVWVDFNRKEVTHRTTAGVASYPARITTTTIEWTISSSDGTPLIVMTIDRTTGVLQAHQPGVIDNPARCTRSSAPMPSTKF
jgi:hypothetical protein